MKTTLYPSALLAAMLLLATTACQEQRLPGDDDQACVTFSATMAADDTWYSRATETNWEANDAIGVFMTASGAGLTTGTVSEGSMNRQYVTPSADGIFRPASGQNIHYPTDGSTVDFYTYYPYRADLSGLTYPVDVSDQSHLAAIDLMVANNVKTAKRGNANALRFERQLSSLALHISASTGVTSLTGLQVTLKGMPVRADYDLAQGTLNIDATSKADITLPVAVSGTTAEVQAILLPAESWTGVSLAISLNGKNYSVAMDQAQALAKGKRLSFQVTLKKGGGSSIDPTPDPEPEPTPQPANTWFETPIVTTGEDLVYITHFMPNDSKVRNYAMLYDKKNKLAYWVAYPMHNYYLGSSGRTDDWGWDPEIDQQWQPELFRGFSTYNTDRGHQIPSADRTRDAAVNRTTFYFTNMTAQTGQGLNQSIWASLEGQVRDWTSQCDTLYVVTGAMITTASDPNIGYVQDNSGALVARPKYYYKALCKKRGNNYYTIGFRFNNEQYSGTDYDNYRVTVSQLEQETGFTFFPSLSDEVKGKIVDLYW